MFTNIVLPRPGASPTPPCPPIPGPSESSFTSTFGSLLPPAQYLHTPNGKAAYYEIHSTTPPKVSHPVLFIHGVQTPALGMLPLARALHASHPSAHFVLLDLWGHGLSDTPVLPHTAELFHELIDELLDHLDWPCAHIVGFSFGASLTVGYASSMPSRVVSYALVAPAGLIRASSFSAEEQALLRHDADEDAAREWVLRFLEGGQLVVPADWKDRVAKGEIVAEAVREWQMREHPGHTASVVAAFRDGGVMDNHAAFAMPGGPAIVVLGEKDDLSTKDELQSLGLLSVYVVPQAGHGVVRQNVQEVAEPISSMWRNFD
jgi:pimeloyl-ACP methyl ester carboxylesterase